MLGFTHGGHLVAGDIVFLVVLLRWTVFQLWRISVLEEERVRLCRKPLAGPAMWVPSVEDAVRHVSLIPDLVVPVDWAVSRRRWNRLMHIKNGNMTSGWKSTGRPPGEARLLQEVHPVGKLRAAGWRIPAAVADGYLLRVYDTRIETPWLLEVAREAAGGDLPAVVVGGDFLSQPHVEDAVTLHPTEVRRWGPGGGATYRVVLPPRPHMAEWARRIVMQMPLEAKGAEMVWFVVVPRD